MARISVDGSPFTRVLLQDLEKKQSLREHTINPPGEERYLNPIDKVALKAKLEELADGTVTDTEVDNFISGTVGDGTGSSGAGDDISLSNIESVATNDIANMTAGEIAATEDQQALQDLISVGFVETTNFLLSFNDGIIKGLLDLGWVKVFTNAGSAAFSL